MVGAFVAAVAIPVIFVSAASFASATSSVVAFASDSSDSADNAPPGNFRPDDDDGYKESSFDAVPLAGTELVGGAVSGSATAVFISIAGGGAEKAETGSENDVREEEPAAAAAACACSCGAA